MKKDGRLSRLLLLLALVIVGLAAFTAFAAWYSGLKNAEQDDAQTAANAHVIATALNRFVSGNNYIPANLQATFNELRPGTITSIPPAITYTKLSYMSYQFCILYKTGHGPMNSTPSNKSLVIPSTHSSGQNCQVIFPYTDPIQVSGSLRVCDILVNKIYGGFQAESSGYISVVSADGHGNTSITLNPVAHGNQGPFIISPNDTVFTDTCSKIAASELKVGQSLYVYKADDSHYVLAQVKLSWY